MALSEKEEKILKSIVVASENDPNKPEFPADNPNFPATPTYRIEVPGFSNVWLKDESVNPTGTHKDRMAWEMVVTYRDFLLAKKRGQVKGPLRPMSIISLGAAALAIQTQMKKYNLPNLKVLIDTNIVDSFLIDSLKRIGCEIYDMSLAKKPLDWDEILIATNNPDGFEITSNRALDPSTRYYDWMSYEIINSSPDYCFIPFGTGNLYENIININKKEVSSPTHDPRFRGNVDILRNCNFIGATSNSPKSKALKLYWPYIPSVHFNEQWMRVYRAAGFCGQQSNVQILKEEFLDKAMDIAESQNVTCEHSGIAGLAMMLQIKDKLPRNKKMLVINTGKTKY